ncbi:MAG: hypothetical protein ACYCW6_00785 [Candidatus Xenobia bacterium]
MRVAPQVAALLLSLFVYPGTGQMYNRQWAKGVLVIVIFSVTLGLWFYNVWILASAFYGGLTTNPEQAQLQDLGPGLLRMVPWMIACLVVYTAAAIDSFVCGARRAAEAAPPAA